MQATILNPAYNLNHNHRKEEKFTDEYTAVCFENGEVKTPVILRIYSTDARNYACIWIHAKDVHASGSGYAGGCGYHRPSAAAQTAINSAGFELSEPIDGRGEGAMQSAVVALAKVLGFENVYLHHAHA